MARQPEPQRPSKITIPEKANPLAKLVFSEMHRQRVTYAELEWRAGVLTSTFKAWRTDNRPGLESIEAALGALGWALVPVPQHERLPENIRAGLEALSAEWAQEEPLLHHLLATACRAAILVKDSGPIVDAVPVRKSVRRRGDPHPQQISLEYPQ
jgi:hypothetical protein